MNESGLAVPGIDPTIFSAFTFVFNSASTIKCTLPVKTGIFCAITSTIGKSFWLSSEKELDVATGLAGSAPAWLAVVAEGLSDGAVNLGLKREISYEFIAALFEGVGIVLRDEHPAILKDKVTSPKGTTIAGITKLEEGKVRDSFIKAMEASYNRTKDI